MEAARLARLLRGELDWIVMKALEKDRNRRYDSAAGFAADVQRFLAGEPVLAVPAGAGYRLRKFLRRHRGTVFAASTVLTTLTAAAVVSTVLAVVADDARTAALKAQDDEHDQRTRAERESARAEANAGDARRSADTAFDRLYGSDIRLIRSAWVDRQYGSARELLAGLAPEHTGGRDLRRFEWSFWTRRLGNPPRSLISLAS